MVAVNSVLWVPIGFSGPLDSKGGVVAIHKDSVLTTAIELSVLGCWLISEEHWACVTDSDEPVSEVEVDGGLMEMSNDESVLTEGVLVTISTKSCTSLDDLSMATVTFSSWKRKRK